MAQTAVNASGQALAAGANPVASWADLHLTSGENN